MNDILLWNNKISVGASMVESQLRISFLKPLWACSLENHAIFTLYERPKMRIFSSYIRPPLLWDPPIHILNWGPIYLLKILCSSHANL